MLRFKTKKEFEKEYGESWRSGASARNFTPRMDCLLGRDVSWHKGIYDFYKGRSSLRGGDFLIDGEKYVVDRWMLTDKPLPGTEKDSRPRWRFKTKSDFKAAWGRDWRIKIMYHWPEGMDYLFDFVLCPDDCAVITDISGLLKNDLCGVCIRGPGGAPIDWAVSPGMFSMCDYTTGHVGDDGYWVEHGARYGIRAGELKAADQLPTANKHSMDVCWELESLKRDYSGYACRQASDTELQRHQVLMAPYMATWNKRLLRKARMKVYISKITTK